MAVYEISSPDGQKYKVTAPEGATEADAINYVKSQFKAEPKSKGVGETLNELIGDTSLSNIGRQVGLTARYGLQGVGDVLDTVASPIRAGLNGLGMNIQGRTGEAAANALGLPKPQGALENVVGKGAEFMAGGAVPMAAATKLAPAVSGTTQAVLRTLAANPASQVASNAGAGMSGELVKQTGGNDAAQLVASVAGGLAAPAALSSGNRAVTAVRNMVSPKQSAQAIDLTIQNVINNGDYGIQYADIGNRVKSQLRDDIGAAMNQGNLDEDAVRRLVDYRLVGATPTRGSLTLDPVQITREKNLAKIGANSSDSTLQGLARTQNANNNVLIGKLNELGANTGDDAISAAQKIMGSVQEKNDAAKSVINDLYDKARGADGRSVPLDGATFTQTADDLLKRNLLQGRLPDDVRSHLNNIAQGKVPFDVDYAEQLKTLMGDISRANRGTPEAKALSLVRQALDNTPAATGIGGDAIDAFNKARRVNAGWMNVVDRTPALQAVRDGIEPDKFVSQYIIGSGDGASVMSVANLKNLVNSDPQAMDAVRGQIASFLKSKAINGSADEVGKVSQSSLNKAINQIGERKLSMFFNKEEIAQLKALGRVASYEQFQPIGSAVNNSNSGALTLGGMLDFIANNKVLSRIPAADAFIRRPASNFSTQIGINNSLNVPAGLLAAQPTKPRQIPMGLLMAPLIGNSTTQQ